MQCAHRACRKPPVTSHSKRWEFLCNSTHHFISNPFQSLFTQNVVAGNSFLNRTGLSIYPSEITRRKHETFISEFLICLFQKYIYNLVYKSLHAWNKKFNSSCMYSEFIYRIMHATLNIKDAFVVHLMNCVVIWRHTTHVCKISYMWHSSWSLCSSPHHCISCNILYRCKIQINPYHRWTLSLLFDVLVKWTFDKWPFRTACPAGPLQTATSPPSHSEKKTRPGNVYILLITT